jgi:hypothetical protein
MDGIMKYVVNMLAMPKSITTSQTGTIDIEQAMKQYLKNAYVSLVSTIMNNPDINAILCTDIDIDVDYPEMAHVFRKHNIRISHVKYGTITIESKSAWSICNYRYDVMKYLVETMNSDDIVLMLDTDTICVSSFADLFDDLHYDLFLYDVNHRHSNSDRTCILDNYQMVYGKTSNLVHYGGEFICSRISIINELLTSCLKVIEMTNNFEGLRNFNDEHITSIAVYEYMRHKVHNSESYIYRYWTNKFYLVSTNYHANPVSIWHLPDQKGLGLIWLYNYLVRTHHLPDINKMAKAFDFPKISYSKLHRIIMKILLEIQR